MKSIRKKTVILLVSGLLSAVLVVILYMVSESRMQNENPFIRRYIPGVATKNAQVRLKNPYYYIAGQAGDKLYLANTKGPLYIVETDTIFSFQREHKISLDRYDFNFFSAEVRVYPPYFYVYDGMVPVIYRGHLSDWKAKVYSHGEDFFTGAQIIDSARVAIRGQKNGSGESIMALLDTNKEKPEYNPDILEKQIDGFFDTSGTMNYSSKLGKFIYVYYFRNQYIITDDNLKKVQRANTIDTTSKAKLKLVKLKNSGDTKLAAPPIVVNHNSAVFNNLLFIHSAIVGKYETPKIWNVASVIDVYDISTHQYFLSFYVYNIPKNVKMKKFYVNGTALYAIIGNELHKYSFGTSLTDKFIKENKKTTGR